MNVSVGESPGASTRTQLGRGAPRVSDQNVVERSRMPDDDPFAVAMRAAGCTGVTGCIVEFKGEPLQARCSREPLGLGVDGAPDMRWHVSVSAIGRVPSWAEFVAVVHHIRPGVMFTVPLPPPQFWLNINPFVLHAYEIHDATLIKAWRHAGGAGQRPS